LLLDTIDVILSLKSYKSLILIFQKNRGLNMQEENKEENEYQDLATQMTERVLRIRHDYPDMNETLEKLQIRLQNAMVTFKTELDKLPTREKDILTLVAIHEIHKIVDEVFEDNLGQI